MICPKRTNPTLYTYEPKDEPKGREGAAPPPPPTTRFSSPSLTTKKPKEQKTAYREHVSLTLEELDRLKAKYGEKLLEVMVDVLNISKGASGRTYRSDAMALQKTWVLEEARKKQALDSGQPIAVGKCRQNSSLAFEKEHDSWLPPPQNNAPLTPEEQAAWDRLCAEDAKSRGAK